jgi:hypothetical protein
VSISAGGFLTATLLALALAACTREKDADQTWFLDNGIANAAEPGSAIANGTHGELATAANQGGDETIDEADDSGSEQTSPPGTPESQIIPAQYRGRWGMVAPDCDRNRSDAKGAITIGERTILFYESTARLKEPRPADANSFSGLFGFTGEGQAWEKVMTFTRTGDSLLRAEEAGRYVYRRCR